ncbi:solute carrier family 23 member 2-like [Mizuhopecten yessoensis]|nr:solute carrier family 23 member 2-like [Mizuhopecten yessoensis]
MALVLGLMIPHWAKQNMDKFETGIQQITSLVQILMTNANFIGGFVACLLDNTLPGTRKDRGMLTWMGVGSDEQVRSSVYMESTEVYDIPFITDILRKFKIAKYIPISPTFHRK